MNTPYWKKFFFFLFFLFQGDISGCRTSSVASLILFINYFVQIISSSPYPSLKYSMAGSLYSSFDRGCPTTAPSLAYTTMPINIMGSNSLCHSRCLARKKENARIQVFALFPYISLKYHVNHHYL